MNEKNISPAGKGKVSAHLRFGAYLYTAMGVLAWVLPSEDYVFPTFCIIATIYAVGSEILREIGR